MVESEDLPALLDDVDFVGAGVLLVFLVVVGAGATVPPDINFAPTGFTALQKFKSKLLVPPIGVTGLFFVKSVGTGCEIFVAGVSSLELPALPDLALGERMGVTLTNDIGGD